MSAPRQPSNNANGQPPQDKSCFPCETSSFRHGRKAMQKVGLGVAALAASLFVAPVAHAQMKVTSDDIKNGDTIKMEQVFNSFTCTGQNMSPSLSWSGAPAATKSFVVQIYDPDAPTGRGWWHWVVIKFHASP